MITFPRTAQEATAADGHYRAGATDVLHRRRLGLLDGPQIDLRDLPLGGIEVSGGLRLGAGEPIASVARHPGVRAGWPMLAAAAGGLATPAIRERATVAGGLLQASRCWYYRNPDFTCLRRGGATCFAREGDHRHHAIFQRSACVAVHPSTLAMALLAYDAEVEWQGGGASGVEGGGTSSVEGSRAPLAKALGDGADPQRTHALPEGALLLAVFVPAPGPERSATLRATQRERAEWPGVEVAIRLGLDGDTVVWSRVVAGAVAAVPLRLDAVERALHGARGRDAILAAAEHAADGAAPLPGTAWKVPVLRALVADALERCLEPAP